MVKECKNILIVDDAEKITEVVSAFLISRGYCTFICTNGTDAFEILDKENIALVILDLMLPDMPGEEICQRIRQKSRVPIIMLTAKSAEKDLLLGLNLGADDYMTKPFSLNELLARMASVLRRSSNDLLPLSLKNIWDEGALSVDFEKNVVKKHNQPVNLTANEMKLLSVFIKYPGRVFTREQLIAHAFGDEFDGYDRGIDTYIKTIRQKIETNPKAPKYILTVHRTGYKFGGE